MSTAKNMRKITKKVQDEYRSQNECERAKHQEEISKKMEELRPKLLAEILANIEAVAKHGGNYCTVDFYKYDTEEGDAKLNLYQELLQELEGKPHELKVDVPRTHEGYNGEGNNMSDFYTQYTWTIRW